jgi:hypothetical protein
MIGIGNETVGRFGGARSMSARTVPEDVELVSHGLHHYDNAFPQICLIGQTERL